MLHKWASIMKGQVGSCDLCDAGNLDRIMKVDDKNKLNPKLQHIAKNYQSVYVVCKSEGFHYLECHDFWIEFNKKQKIQ